MSEHYPLSSMMYPRKTVVFRYVKKIPEGNQGYTHWGCSTCGFATFFFTTRMWIWSPLGCSSICHNHFCGWLGVGNVVNSSTPLNAFIWGSQCWIMQMKMMDLSLANQHVTCFMPTHKMARFVFHCSFPSSSIWIRYVAVKLVGTRRTLVDLHSIL